MPRSRRVFHEALAVQRSQAVTMALARRAMLPQVSGSPLSDKPTTVLGSVAFAYPYNLSIASHPRFIESRLRPAATRLARFARPSAIFRSSVTVM